MIAPRTSNGRTGTRAVLVLLACAVPGLAAAAEFRTRALGHVFRCGARVVEFDRDGGATVSTEGDPTILAATRATWTRGGVRLSFAKPADTLSLSAFGTTVSAKASDGSAVCVNVR